jgi:DNA-binding transcriptional regulator YiaG
VTVTFRNVDVRPDEPLETWPYEAIVTMIERGTITDWARLTREIRRRPWGAVARQVEHYLGYEQPWGVGPLLQRALAGARAERAADERCAVAAEVRELVARSGLSTRAFADAIGTSRPRLSTYRSGRVTPSAAMMLRMRALVDDLEHSASLSRNLADATPSSDTRSGPRTGAPS